MKTNGHGHANGQHAPPSPELEQIARCEAHARGQERLREDAARQLARAAEERAAAERAHAAAVEAHAAAIYASAAQTADDGLLDAVVRAAARATLARTALDTAVREHASASATHRTASASVDAAQTEIGRARTRAELDRPERIGDLVDAGRAIIAALCLLRSGVERARTLIVEDRERVRGARGLGVVAEGADGLPVAFGMAKALVDLGADLRFVENQLRWDAPDVPAHEPPLPLEASASKIATVVLGVLGKPPIEGATVTTEIATWEGRISYAALRAAQLPPRPPPPVARVPLERLAPGEVTTLIGRRVVPQGDRDGEFELGD